jgi:hypothetical protein
VPVIFTPLWYHLLDVSGFTSDVVRGGISAIADTYVPSADLLKNKSRPEAAAEGAAAWVISERELREKLKREREAKERELEKEVRLVRPVITDIRAPIDRDLRKKKEKKRKARQRSLMPSPRKRRPRRMIR